MMQFPESARRRLQSQAPTQHPDPGLLTAFAEQSLTASERQTVLTHLAMCTVCREVVALATPELLPTEAPRAAAPSWFRWPVLRWTAVAATIVIVGAAVSVLGPRRNAHDVSVPAQSVEKRSAPATRSIPESRTPEQRAAIAKESQQQRAAAPPARHARDEARASKPTIAPAQDTQVAGNNAAAENAPVAKIMADVPPPPAEPDKKKDLDASRAVYAQAQTAPAPPPKPQNVEVSAANETVEVTDALGPKTEPSVAAGTLAANKVAPAPAPQQRSMQTMKMKSAIGGTVPAQAVADSLRIEGESWRVNAAGALEHHDPSGTWKKWKPAPRATFRAVAALGSEVWAGGDHGVLYRSSDAGRTWTRVPLVAGYAPSSESIRSISLDAAGVSVTTASGAAWTSHDGGATWNRP